eukprot:m.228503 g.228503  ORF g.228503 m.228503 type:complete len:1130 (+) comp18829_c1_seq1:180-3569(+)
MPTIRGLQVDFPFDPYDVQLAFMDKMIQALESQQNALLESPTGTGKTLCLLCAALAWREGFKQRQPGHRQPQPRETLQDRKKSTSFVETKVGLPQIIFASRTHSQLSQVAKELKATSYKPRVCLLASRDQLCLNKEVQAAESNTAKNNLCRRKVTTGACQFFRNLNEQSAPNEIMDIEDLVALGAKEQVCPYYMGRQGQDKADIILLPYNYVLDPQTRAAQNINFSGSIVIFDEAHNIAQCSEDSSSFHFDGLDLAACIGELDQLIAEASTGLQIDQAVGDDDLHLLKQTFLQFERLVLDVEIGERGTTQHGRKMYDLWKRAGLTFREAHAFIPVLEDAANQLLKRKTSRGRCSLTKILDLLKFLFPPHETAVPQFVDDYRLHFSKAQPSKPQANTKRKRSTFDAPAPAAQASSSSGSVVVDFWCFAPGLGFEDLRSHGARSIILTSGTLSPLDAFAAELQMPFPVRLENKHVIAPKQVWIEVVKQGPSRVTLDASYRNRGSDAYKTDLGNAIVNFARCIPRGLLVFFPSYGFLDQCVQFWHRRGPDDSASVWERLDNIKHIVVEPRGKSDFLAKMHVYYEKVRDKACHGAVLLAVCRGKVSEGLDFTDDFGRGVIIVGLPFANAFDPRVNIKRGLLDDAKQNTKISWHVRQQLIGGREWYLQTATRAVNQAIGRVIRHKNDYGAIILCDQRFADRNTMAQLPVWLREKAKVSTSFGDSQASLAQFFKRLQRDTSLQQTHLPVDINPVEDEPISAPPAPLAPRQHLAARGREPATRVSADVSYGLDRSESSDDEDELQGAQRPRASLMSLLGGRKVSVDFVDAPYRPTLTTARTTSGVGGGGLTGHLTAQQSVAGGVKCDAASGPGGGLFGGRSTSPCKPQAPVRKRRKQLYVEYDKGDGAAAGAEPSAGPTPAQSLAKSAPITSTKSTAQPHINRFVLKLKAALGDAEFSTFMSLLAAWKKGKGAGKLSSVERSQTFARGLRELLLPRHASFLSELLEVVPAKKKAELREALVLAEKESSRQRDAEELQRGHQAVSNALQRHRSGGAPEAADKDAAVANDPMPANRPGACGKCGETLRQPFRSTVCGHTCCYQCWKQLLSNTMEVTCPQTGCTAAIRSRNLKKAYLTS